MHLATFCANRKGLFFFRRKLFVFVECHPSFRSVSLKAMGELTVGPKIIDQTVQRRMRSVLKKIRSGQFARGVCSRNENWPKTLRAVAAGGRGPFYRKGGCATARHDGLACKNINLPPHCRGGSTPAPAKSSEFLIISPYDSRK
jgi:hypothetical protein